LAGKRHIDIGKEILAEKGVVPENDADVYTQMFKLKYIRVVEYVDGRVEVESTCKMSTHQKRFLDALRDAGKMVVFLPVKR